MMVAIADRHRLRNMRTTELSATRLFPIDRDFATDPNGRNYIPYKLMCCKENPGGRSILQKREYRTGAWGKVGKISETAPHSI
jgi:hypothetical protein